MLKSLVPQQTQGIDPMSFICWSTSYHASLALRQHWLIFVVKWLLRPIPCPQSHKAFDPSLILHYFLAPAVTVGERRELWILPPFFFGPFFCL